MGISFRPNCYVMESLLCVNGYIIRHSVISYLTSMSEVIGLVHVNLTVLELIE